MQQTSTTTHTDPRLDLPPAALFEPPPDRALYSASPLHRAAEPPSLLRTRVLPIVLIAASILALCEILVLWRMQARIAATDAKIAGQRERILELLNLRPDIPLIIQTSAPSAVVTAEPAASEPAPARPKRSRPKAAPPKAAEPEPGLKEDCANNPDPLCGIGFADDRR